MSAREDKLGDASVWDDGGHLREPALHALADGELEILPSEALRHAEACARCGERVGEIALFALEIAAAISAPQLTAARLPLRAIAASLMLALVTGWPALRTWLPQLAGLGSPSLWAGAARGLAQVLAHAAHTGVLNAMVWTSAAGLLAASAALVRFSARSVRLGGER